MTTIVYRNGIMAADSSVWEEGTLSHKMKKLHRLKDGSVVGIFGTVSSCINLIEYLKDNKKKPKSMNGAGAIIAFPDGRLLSCEGSTVVPIEKARYLAAGSGMSVALGALHQGATAIQAVKAAIAHDASSRGPVKSMRIKPGKGRGRKRTRRV
jgi:20S proteasome alpha/beta subunit